MKDLTITIGVAAALAAGTCQAAALDPPQDASWTADRDTVICVDQNGVRVPDEQCPPPVVAGRPHAASPFLWYYLGRYSAVPSYGVRASGGSYSAVAGHGYARAPVVASHRSGRRTAGAGGALAVRRGWHRAGPVGHAASRRSHVARGGFGRSAHSHGSAHG